MRYYKQIIEDIKKKNLYRFLKPIKDRTCKYITVNDKEYIDFSSNDYLGYSEHPALKKVAVDAINKFGTGSTASRLLSGDSELMHTLESAIADFKGKESGLVFNSGYQANLGLISSLANDKDVIFSDKLNHASMIDGSILSGAKLIRYRHNDMAHLETLVKKHRSFYNKALIITESVFSMEGDFASLNEIVDIKKKYDIEILVDEAHATGLYGKKGAGLIEKFNLTDKIDYIMGTFGKALGSFGAYFVSSKEVIEYMINSCRSFIFTTALPPSVIAVNIKAIELITKEKDKRTILISRADSLRKNLSEGGFEIRGESNIIPILIKDIEKTIKLAELIREKGFWALPIRPPAVPDDESRIRISLTYNHDDDIIRKFTEQLLYLKKCLNI